MEEHLSKKIAASAYPPDGVPFVQAEQLADAYAVILGQADLPHMSAPHLAAWGVMLGVLSKRQAAAAVAEAREAANDPNGRLAELRRLLTPYFADCGNVEAIVVKLRTELTTPDSLAAETAEWANKIMGALRDGLEAPGEAIAEVSVAAIVAGAHIRAERLEAIDVWGLVAEARRMNAGDPVQAFHSLIYWIERLRLVADNRTPPAAPLVFDMPALLAAIAPSAN